MESMFSLYHWTLKTEILKAACKVLFGNTPTLDPPFSLPQLYRRG